jgi:mutator protein MutT
MQKIIPVVAAIIVKENKILAARRKDGLHLAGYWEFPGGKVEPSESHETALVRELKEEFGISANVDYFVGANTHQYGEKSIKLSAYRVQHLSGDFQLRDHDKIEWIDPHQLYTLNWAPADIPLIDDFLRIFSIGEYYDKNAFAYAEETNSLEVTSNLEKFISQLDTKAHILDLGCGSGRDTKTFLEKGYQVTAVDGSAKLAAIAEKRIGQKVNVTLFQNLNFPPTFDGVWACASLLHCPPQDLETTILNIYNSLLPDGLLYVSVKHGNSLATDNKSRLFTYFTEKYLKETVTKSGLFEVEEYWSETKPLRNAEQKWLNVLCRKSASRQ